MRKGDKAWGDVEVAAGVPGFWEGVRLGLAGSFPHQGHLVFGADPRGERREHSYILISAPHSTVYKVGSKLVRTAIPILQKGETEAPGGTLICSRSHQVSGAVES